MHAPIFISYSSHDHKVAETICAALENRGLRCWIASRNIEPGENFQSEIVRAIRHAKVMLLVFTSHANNSEEIKKELVLAGRSKLIVMPLRVEDVTPDEAFDYEFATRQWIDLFDDWERALDHLVQQLTLAVGSQAATPPSSESEGPPSSTRERHTLPAERRSRDRPGTGRARRTYIAVAAGLILLAGTGIGLFELVLKPADTSGSCQFSQWLDAGGYQQVFDRKITEREFPEKIEGRSADGRREYRGCFRAYPHRSNFAFESRHDVPPDYFDRRDRELKAIGYTLRYMQRFQDQSGPSIQATWTLND